MKKLLLGLVYVAGAVTTYCAIKHYGGNYMDAEDKGAAIAMSLVWPATAIVGGADLAGAGIVSLTEKVGDLLLG